MGETERSLDCRDGDQGTGAIGSAGFAGSQVARWRAVALVLRNCENADPIEQLNGAQHNEWVVGARGHAGGSEGLSGGGHRPATGIRTGQGSPFPRVIHLSSTEGERLRGLVAVASSTGLMHSIAVKSRGPPNAGGA